MVIDLQKGVVGIPCVHPMDAIVANSARLAAAFRAHGLPVVLVNATGRAPGRAEAAARPAGATPQADWADLVPELNAAPDDLLIAKQTWGAFHHTPLHERLQERNVTQVVPTGVATTAGVEVHRPRRLRARLQGRPGHRRDDRPQRRPPRQQRPLGLPATRGDDHHG